MFFIILPIIIFILVGGVIAINFCFFIKKQNRRYELVDYYFIKKETSIYFKSFRHLRVYASRIGTQKAIHLYLSEDGRYFETVARTLLDKELTVLDKDVFVLRVEDQEQNKLLISYDVERVSSTYLKFLEKLNISDYVLLKEITKEQTVGIPTYSITLVNEQSLR